MKNILKKSLAAVMAVASLTVGMVGMSAGAYSSADSYSKFTWNINGNDAYATLKNTSGSSRYGQAVVFSYALDGSYNGQSNAAEGVIASQASITSSDTPYGNSYEFCGTMYLTGYPQGTPISTWVKTLSR